MNEIQEEMKKFRDDILNFHIPRWEELPDIELYMDQVVTFIEKEFSFFSTSTSEKIITPSMINNYVKLNLIPKPVKKKYNKTHLAYLIAISILKHVFTIQKVRDGIHFQAELNGEKIAYNTFCEEQEEALKYLIRQIDFESEEPLPAINYSNENIAIKMVTLAFATKIIAERIIGLKKNHNDNKSDN